MFYEILPSTLTHAFLHICYGEVVGGHLETQTISLVHNQRVVKTMHVKIVHSDLRPLHVEKNLTVSSVSSSIESLEVHSIRGGGDSAPFQR
jgi:hypothetical protein